MNEVVHEHLSDAAAKNVELWLNDPKYAEYKSQLDAMIEAQEWQALEDAFFMKLSFGTAGIRGITGLGSARISRVTIGESTQALCEYVKSLDANASEKGIVIACDTRLTSDEFSRLAAEVCAGNGVKAYWFDGFRSTPELSFAVRHLKAAAGIVISASHNFPTDNGFKACLSDGGQLVSPHDKAVVAEVEKVNEIHKVAFDEAIESGEITVIGEAVDDAYIAAVLQESLGSERDLRITYSPLHGAGQRNSLPVLKNAGFDVMTVERQMSPDGNFPTVENNKPNPEEKVANDLAVSAMMAHETDIAMTNDPDADRIGVMARQGDEPKYFTGNQAAALAAEFAIYALQRNGNLTEKHYIAKTIVTTDLLYAVAKNYGVTVYGDMLIGFKYIGQLLLEKESSDEVFIMGGEESYGLLRGGYARDKDGAMGALMLAEYAAELKAKGKTLYDQLLSMYATYGLYVERLDNIVCPGSRGFEQMQSIMKRLRDEPLQAVGHHEISATRDYLDLTRMSKDGSVSAIKCSDKGNVIVLEFGDYRRRITIRPSGTEPKLKLYIQWYEDPASSDPESIERQYEAVADMIEGISRELEGLLLEA